MANKSTFFAPMLYLNNVAAAIEFYKNAFNAIELQRWSNNDGSVHVAELSIEGALFHLHEEAGRKNELSPATLQGTTVIVGLFVEEPDAIMVKAVAAGGIETSALKDYEYGYRQGNLTDTLWASLDYQKKDHRRIGIAQLLQKLGKCYIDSFRTRGEGA